jgi:hypothetical protein
MKIIQRQRGVHYCKNMGGFSLAVSYLLCWEDRIIDFLGGGNEMIEGKLRAAHLLLASS